MERYERDRLILDNQRLVYYMYKKLSKTEIVIKNKDDIVSEGIIGLIIAANTFDSSRGSKFSSYAGLCIRNSMLMYLRKLNKYWNREVSLYAPPDKETSDAELCYADIAIVNQDKNAEKRDDLIWLQTLIDRLPEKDKEIITAVIAGYTQKEIAVMMGVQQASISRRYKRIKNRLKTELNSSLCQV